MCVFLGKLISFFTKLQPRELRCLEPTAHTPPEARLRLLLVGGVSFPFSFQFFTRLAAVFAEEVGGFGMFAPDGRI